jgi:hypothetical protein
MSGHTSDLETNADALNENTSAPSTNEKSSILAAMSRAMSEGGTQLDTDSSDELVRKYSRHMPPLYTKIQFPGIYFL